MFHSDSAIYPNQENTQDNEASLRKYDQMIQDKNDHDSNIHGYEEDNNNVNINHNNGGIFDIVNNHEKHSHFHKKTRHLFNSFSSSSMLNNDSIQNSNAGYPSDDDDHDNNKKVSTAGIDRSDYSLNQYYNNGTKIRNGKKHHYNNSHFINNNNNNNNQTSSFSPFNFDKLIFENSSSNFSTKTTNTPHVRKKKRMTSNASLNTLEEMLILHQERHGSQQPLSPHILAEKMAKSSYSSTLNFYHLNGNPSIEDLEIVNEIHVDNEVLNESPDMIQIDKPFDENEEIIKKENIEHKEYKLQEEANAEKNDNNKNNDTPENNNSPKCNEHGRNIKETHFVNTIHQLNYHLNEKIQQVDFVLQENKRINKIIQEYESIIDSLKSQNFSAQQENIVLHRLLKMGWSEQERMKAIQENKVHVLSKLSEIKKVHNKLDKLVNFELKNEFTALNDFIVGVDRIQHLNDDDNNVNHEQYES